MKIKDKVYELFERKNIINIEEYSLNSVIGTDIRKFFKDILKEILSKNVEVKGKEISDGKYEITINIEDKEYEFVSKAWYNKIEIAEIIEEVIEEYLKSKDNQ